MAKQQTTGRQSKRREGYRMSKDKMLRKLIAVVTARQSPLCAELVIGASSSTITEIDDAAKGDPDAAYRLLFPPGDGKSS